MHNVQAEAAVNEAELLEQARRRDLKAFSSLVLIYEERMIHFAYSFLGNMEDARDLAQEAFVKAYEALPGFKSRSRFSTWLYRIVVNKSKDFLRKNKDRKNILSPSSFDAENPDSRDPLDTVAGKERNARQSLIDGELKQAIYLAMEGLPFQQRTAFAMRYLEGMSLDEIATAMNLSTGAVKAHLWQAGQKMKASLQNHLPGGGEGHG